MATRKKNIVAPKGTLLIVTATEAEALFFSQMRKDCRFTNLTVMNIEAKNLNDFIIQAARLKNRNHYDRAFALFGFDDLNTNVEEVKEAIPMANKKKLELAYFNPSFDLWVYLHVFAQPKSFVADKGIFNSAIAQKLEGYALTSDFFLNNGLNFHMQLFPRHAMADLAARNYNDLAKAQVGLEATSMPELNKAITEICGQADMSHNTKVFK